MTYSNSFAKSSHLHLLPTIESAFIHVEKHFYIHVTQFEFKLLPLITPQAIPEHLEFLKAYEIIVA